MKMMWFPVISKIELLCDTEWTWKKLVFQKKKNTTTTTTRGRLTGTPPPPCAFLHFCHSAVFQRRRMGRSCRWPGGKRVTTDKGDSFVCKWAARLHFQPVGGRRSIRGIKGWAPISPSVGASERHIALLSNVGETSQRVRTPDKLWDWVLCVCVYDHNHDH